MIQELAPLIKDLTIMLGIASIVTILFQKIKQPVVLGYIIAGIIIGPYTPPYSLVKDATQIQTLSDIGVIFLMFALGLDFSFHKIKKIGFSALITGIIKVAVMSTIGFLAGRAMNWPFYNSIFLGAALAISSTTIIIKVLDELNLRSKRFTDVVFGILIVEDLIAILMLTTLSTLSNINSSTSLLSLDLLWDILKLLTVVGSWFLLGYFLIPILFKKVIKNINQETLTITSIALCLGLSIVAAYFHYSTALGSFIMGSVLADAPVGPRIKKLILPLRDVFAAVFFISIGMLIDIKTLLAQWHTILTISALAITGKIIATSVGTFLTGQSLNTSVRIGFSMAPIGEFSFIIATTGMMLHIVDASFCQIITGVAAVTILAAPYLIKLSNNIVKVLDNNMSERTRYFFDSYTAWVYRALASYQNQTEYRRFAFRLITNGFIIIIIFKLAYNFILPYLEFFLNNINIAKIFSWIIALITTLPSLWGMLFSFRLIHKSRRLPPLFLCLILAIAEITVLSITYFSSWYIPLAIASLAIIFFGILSKKLGMSYNWFERRFIRLLQNRQYKQTKYEELAPWDTHLVEVIATNEKSPSVVGKTLAKSQLRQKFGINIVAICRGSKTISTPRGNEKIMPNDKLIIIGNDEQIDAFKKNVERESFELQNEEILKNFVLKALLLEKNSPLINQSIRESHVREQILGLVVGLERNGFRILNPDPTTVLKEHDLLLVVGEEEAIYNLSSTAYELE